MRVLSIDWDFFFPDSAPYDWGHSEVMFFLEMVWSSRVDSQNMMTGADALTGYKPKIPRDFWSIVLNKPLLFVAESHASIARLPIKNATVVNLDAHHDCGYGEVGNQYLRLVPGKGLDCGNWVKHLGKKIREYRLHYPVWREDGQEAGPERKPNTILKGLPAPAVYDFVFVCRSGCWTPPWYDDVFQRWLKRSGLDRTPLDDMVMKIRTPNLKEAQVLKKNFAHVKEKLFRCV